jgi:hypothetical protein
MDLKGPDGSASPGDAEMKKLPLAAAWGAGLRDRVRDEMLQTLRQSLTAHAGQA